MTDVRVGQGFDVHRLARGRKLVLCGVEIEHDVGLDGHSDADVALHAVTDALLGAVAAGDLGEHFPATDPRWRDAPSRRFVAHAMAVVADRGYTITNCDLTLIGDRPRISLVRAALRDSLAEILGLATDRVSVKATTTEGLGFAGRGEGLAALAVVTVRDRSP